MSNAAYLVLLRDSTNDDSMLPFFENPINDDITKILCIACINAGEQRFLGVEITHLCKMFTVESTEVKIYACRLFSGDLSAGSKVLCL